jgi:rfaE bifunctional protein nucleotidyltransferase chain/domain
MHRIDPHHKIMDVQTLAQLRADWKASGMRVVFTNGVFDLLHPGHIQYLSEAKALGNTLIVAVNTDPSARSLGKGMGRPINDQEHRASVVAALQSVDAVVFFNEPTPEALVASILPDVLVKGGDYRPEEVAGGPVVRAHGGEVRVLDFIDGFSTTAIEQKIKNQNP